MNLNKNITWIKVKIRDEVFWINTENILDVEEKRNRRYNGYSYEYDDELRITYYDGDVNIKIRDIKINKDKRTKLYKLLKKYIPSNIEEISL